MRNNDKFWYFFWLILSCFWTAWNSYQFAMTKSTFSLSVGFNEVLALGRNDPLEFRNFVF